MVFHPEVAEMYPDGFCAAVDIESEMTKQLCGKSRATHFKGVCTVVSKLFNIVGADKAYFGEKDAQQLADITQQLQECQRDYGSEQDPARRAELLSRMELLRKKQDLARMKCSNLLRKLD